MIKESQLAQIVKAVQAAKAMATTPSAKALAGRLVGGAAGGATGAAVGHEVTPHLFGYEDVPKARTVSAYGDAMVGTAIGTILGSKGSRRWGAAKLRALPATAQLALASSPVMAEAAPMMAANLIKQREAAQAAGDASRASAAAAAVTSKANIEAANTFSDAAESLSIPNAVSKAIHSNTARGATAGAAGAGLASILTGTLRRKNQEEVVDGTTRPAMMQKDFLKYLLPALVAGGIGGSMINSQSST